MIEHRADGGDDFAFGYVVKKGKGLVLHMKNLLNVRGHGTDVITTNQAYTIIGGTIRKYCSREEGNGAFALKSAVTWH